MWAANRGNRPICESVGGTWLTKRLGKSSIFVSLLVWQGRSKFPALKGFFSREILYRSAHPCSPDTSKYTVALGNGECASAVALTKHCTQYHRKRLHWRKIVAFCLL